MTDNLPLTLPPDIASMIKKKFAQPADQAEVQALLQSLWSIPLNVGSEQLSRAILHLSGGTIEEIRQIRDTGFFGDPRDLIMIAAQKPGMDTSQFFINPFEEKDFSDSEHRDFLNDIESSQSQV